jgi:hypothetical protein
MNFIDRKDPLNCGILRGGRRFDVVTVSCCNRSAPSDLKLTVQIILMYKTVY